MNKALKKLISLTLILCIFLTALSSCMGGEAQRGTLWFYGEGLPADVEGAFSGDFYVDTASSDVYSKTDSGWTFLFNMSGNDGKNGSDGSDGKDGTDGKDGAAWLDRKSVV